MRLIGEGPTDAMEEVSVAAATVMSSRQSCPTGPVVEDVDGKGDLAGITSIILDALIVEHLHVGHPHGPLNPHQLLLASPSLDRSKLVE